MSFTLLPDKSTIQMLSEREAYWMQHFFYVLIAPVLLTETLGNLHKEWRDKREPRPFLASLARKIKGMHAYHNIESDEILRVELSGQFVPMDGRPLVGGAEDVVDDTGARGVYFDVAPQDEALDRWGTQTFSPEEIELAELWRRGIGELKSVVAARNIGTLNRTKISSVSAALSATDAFIQTGPQWQVLRTIFSVFEVPAKGQSNVKGRWIEQGRPPIYRFLPYVTFRLRLLMVYALADNDGLLPDRATNTIDLHYLHYLPFCKVFASNDKLHQQLTPGLLRSDQCYMPANDLKQGLCILTAYYQDYAEELKTQGSMKFARYLPLELNTPIHDIFDRIMPQWRTNAERPPEPPMSKADEARLMAKLKPMMEAIQDRQRTKGNPV